jgi:NADPH2:quinone reductase
VKKIIIQASGDADVLKTVQAETPLPNDGELVVELGMAGVNYLDIYQRQGSVNVPTPFTPGFEGVGTIRRVGAGVSGLHVGQRVAWINVFGSYAEQVAVPAEQAIIIPDSFSASDALLFQAITAQYLLAEYRNIRPGDIVLVHAAAGGVGQILVQWLKHLGATVIGTASNEEKLHSIRAVGADHTINYSHGFLEAVLELTGGRGVDVAFDAVGATTFASTVKALAPRGMAIAYGQASGLPPDVEVLPLILKGARVAGASLFVYIGDPKEMQARAHKVIDGIREGWLRMGAANTFALNDAAAAHRAIEARATQGKLALVP